MCYIGADNEEVGHGGQLPQDRGSGVWQHCAGRWGAGQGAPEEVVLSRAGLQIPQGKSVLLHEGGTGLQAQVLQIPRLMYGAAESWALTEAQGAQLETFHNGC